MMSKSRPASAPNTGVSFVEVMDFVANNSRSAEATPTTEAEIIDALAPVTPPTATPSAVVNPDPSVTQATAAPTRPATDSAAGSQPTTGKREAALPEGFDYANTFLEPVRTRKTKAIYVDEDLHKALAVLTQLAGVGLADLLINIANDHFARYRPVIQKYMSDQEKLRRKQLPY